MQTQGVWYSLAPCASEGTLEVTSPRAAASPQRAAALSEKKRPVGCLTQCSAAAGLGKRLCVWVHTRCAHRPPSPQAKVAEDSDCPGCRRGRKQVAKLPLPLGGGAGKLRLRLRRRGCGSERRSRQVVIPRSPASRDTQPSCQAWGACWCRGGCPSRSWSASRQATAPCDSRGTAANKASHRAKPRTHLQSGRKCPAALRTRHCGPCRTGT